MENERKQFSENFWYTKDNEEIRVFTHECQSVCIITLEFDEENLKMKYQINEFTERFQKIELIWEIVISLIESALINSCVALEVNSIPMNQDDFEYLIHERYIKFFGDRFRIIKIEPVPLLNVQFEIVQQRNTHYIQQAYLRNFSSNKSDWEKSGDKDNARIFMFNKGSGTIETLGNTPIEKKFGPKISSIAKEEYFHSLLFEATIACTIEKKIPPILDKIIKTRTIRNLSVEDKEELVKYVIFTWQRTKEARLGIKEMMEKSFLIEAKRFFKEDLPENVYVNYNELSLKIHHEKSILEFIATNSPHNLSKHFMDFTFCLLKAKKSDFFLTSDNPVVRNNTYYLREKKKGNNFIKKRREMMKQQISRNPKLFILLEATSEHPERAPRKKGVEFYMPISPYLCICFYDKQDKIKPLKAQKINKEIILQSNKYIYSHLDKLGFINKVLKKHPTSINKTGKRSIIIDNSEEIPKEILDQLQYKNLPKETLD